MCTQLKIHFSLKKPIVEGVNTHKLAAPRRAFLVASIFRAKNDPRSHENPAMGFFWGVHLDGKNSTEPQENTQSQKHVFLGLT